MSSLWQLLCFVKRKVLLWKQNESHHCILNHTHRFNLRAVKVIHKLLTGKNNRHSHVCFPIHRFFPGFLHYRGLRWTLQPLQSVILSSWGTYGIGHDSCCCHCYCSNLRYVRLLWVDAHRRFEVSHSSRKILICRKWHTDENCMCILPWSTSATATAKSSEGGKKNTLSASIKLLKKREGGGDYLLSAIHSVFHALKTPTRKGSENLFLWIMHTIIPHFLIGDVVQCIKVAGRWWQRGFILLYCVCQSTMWACSLLLPSAGGVLHLPNETRFHFCASTGRLIAGNSPVLSETVVSERSNVSTSPTVDLPAPWTQQTARGQSACDRTIQQAQHVSVGDNDRIHVWCVPLHSTPIPVCRKKSTNALVFILKSWTLRTAEFHHLYTISPKSS